MKTTHITKAIALVMTLMMLIGCVPTSVLPVFALSASESGNGVFDTVTLGKGTVTNTESYNAGALVDAAGNAIVDNTLSPYEPYSTDSEDHPFLPLKDAWINLKNIYYGAPATPNMPITKWSANTSVVNITGTGKYYGADAGVVAGKEIYAIDDMNLIDEYLWVNGTLEIGNKTENGVANSNGFSDNATTVVKKDNATADTAYVYNRYDAMQGKWGLTLDKNVSSVSWTPTYAQNYYGTNKSLNNSILYLSDTPYLFYSTEAPDSTKISISLLIGMQTQSEKKNTNKTNGETYVYTKNPSTGVENNWEFRWYTITDNSPRPGVDYEATKNNSMIPLVTISDVLYTDDANKTTIPNADAIQSARILELLGNNNKMNPLELAAQSGKNVDEMFVDGAITGCIDFTQLLPLAMDTVNQMSDDKGNGREDVKYKIAQIRVDTKTEADKPDSAARINYMYFGPGQAAIYTPQSTVGNDVNAINWQYGQLDGGMGDQNPNYVAKTQAIHYIGNSNYDFDSGYTNGWENGQAVSITNTPANPQLMTVDTYGQGNGKLISYADYTTYMSKLTSDAHDQIFTKGSTDTNSKIWQFTDANGNVQFMEAEYNSTDGNYYIMVAVPFRKWIDVLGTSRKLSLTLDMKHYGVKADGKTELKINPTFMFWGNNKGSVGPGHQSIANGGRYRNDGMVAVFGNGFYHVDTGANYQAVEIDRTLGDSTIYNLNGATKTESWYDILRSPYVYDEMVRYGRPLVYANDNVTITDGCGYGDEMIGYIYLTALRFAVPIGTKFSVQNMKGDGNSAGLNTYSASGSIVSAYDGGTGAQPEINVSKSNAETQAVKSGTTVTSQTYGDGVVKGTQTNGAAAYGPLLTQAFYTIYDLLDTERLATSGNNAHAASNEGRNIQPVYGVAYVTKGSRPVYIYPNTEKAAYGKTYSGSTVTVYGRITFSNTGRVWGLVGVVTDSGNPEIGYIELRTNSTNWVVDEIYHSGDMNADADVTWASYSAWESAGEAWNYPRRVLSYLRNNWAYSNLVSQFGNIQDANGNGIGVIDWAQPTASDIYYAKRGSNADAYTGYNGPVLMYANHQATGARAFGKAAYDYTIRAVNGTDMEVQFKRSKTTDHESIGITRYFENPVALHKGPTDKAKYPVLYYDMSGNFGSNDYVALIIRVDNTPYLYYLNSSGKLTTSMSGIGKTMLCGYTDLSGLLTTDFPGKTVEIVGVTMYFWKGSGTSSGTYTIRRLEVWQEDTAYLDELISQKPAADSVFANKDFMIADSMNLINDSFYHYNDETSDGTYTYTKTSDTTHTGHGGHASYWYDVNDSTSQTSYIKDHSNKGWQARLKVDVNKDGQLDSKDPEYFGYNTTSQEGLYEYRTSLGHLRVWVPSGQDTSVVFEADRSFNTKNYRYLYYSYSMRNTDYGISEENQSADGKGSGIALAIKGHQHSSDNAYLETKDGSWQFFDKGTTYWANNEDDSRYFTTSKTAAVDLSTMDGLESINQLVFYLRNTKDKTAEFYLNYVTLSNVPPETLIADEINQPQYQYYYLMDNTGDRYSARFPTIDNPTGQVSGLNSDNDRVNPVTVNRGKRLSEAKYFNGDPLYGYGGTASTNRVFNENTGSVGYYEKTYGHDSTPNAPENGSMKNILFYWGSSNDLNDINDYYIYKDAQGSEGDIYDMRWSYGRWYTGTGESGLNTLYIGDPDNLGPNDTANSVSGALIRRFATENNVLLRAGIMPKTYTTYFDANGGEFIYDTSADDVSDLRQVTENNYFVTENVILSYFQQPYNIEAMKGDIGNQNTEFLKKPGYKFSHWEHYTDYTTKNEQFNVVDGEVTSADGNGARFMTFIKKTGATPDYFKAVWVVDTDTYPADERHHAKFLDTNGDVLKTITVGGETVDVNARYGRFLLNFPNTTVLYSGHDKVAIYGWQIQGDTSGRIFSAGEKIYLLDDGEFMDDNNTVTFVPVTSPDKMNTFEITLHNAELFVKVKNYANQIVDRPAEDYGITLRKSGNEYTYSGVMENYSLVAKPVESAKNAENGWTLVVENADVSQKKHVINGLVPVLSENSERYEFTAHENIEISYSSITSTIANAFYTANEGIYVTTSPRLTTDGNKGENKPAVYFTSQFTIDNDNVVYEDILASGTLLTKSTYYDKFADVNTAFALDMSTVTADTVANKTYKTMDTKAVRSLQATAVSSNYEYTAYIGHTKAEPATYYARAYVIYKDGNTVKVAYSDVIAWDIGSYTA
ncbi:MAG: hypothetical protein E7553_04060 [Ruminococcaceae bacterium]|nr:hypothetical protein [Oscillospiraceae bacterium]